MSTVKEIIEDALELTGLHSPHETLSPQWETIGLKRMNSILDGWNVTKLKGYTINDYSLPLQANKGTYSIGSGGDFDVDRPVRIENAYSDDDAGVTYPIIIIQYDQWDSISLKDTDADFPSYLFYNPSYPLGEIKLYPVPQKSYTLKMRSWYGFDKYSTTSENVIVPDGYERLLTYQLACELCSHRGKQIPQDVKDTYRDIDSEVDANNFALWMPTTVVNTPSSQAKMGTNRTFLNRGI